MRRSTFLAAIGALLAGPIAAPVAAADAWPSRPIKLVIPAAAGTGSDLVARAQAERLSAALKQPVIVDNKPGASGIIATKAVLNAPADGYTLLYSNASATVMYAAMKPDLGIDFSKDLIPITLTAVGGVFLLTHPDFPARNLKELVAVVKANPGKYTYASWAIGSNGHLTMEWLKKQTGMKIDHVAYKSMPSLLTELSTGIVPIAWTDPISSVPFIQAGKVRAIAVNGDVRTPQLPQLETMGEQGYPFPLVGWQGIFAPAGTPDAIVKRIHAEALKIQSSPEAKAQYLKMNAVTPPPKSPDEFRAMIVRDLEEWRRIAHDAKITLD
jgi:tripartite-type tricarboxylate transporter receptor subunit TctC